MRRREFIAGLGAAAWPLPTHAQQASIPVIGYLHISSPGPFVRYLGALKAGLKEGGYVEGENVAIEYRWADGHPDRLPALAEDLVRRGVSLIATGGGEQPALAAKAATTTIPVVFVVGIDPIKLGIVPSLARPAGNVTGISMLTATLENKRFGLLRELIPVARTIAAMIDASRSVSQSQAEVMRDAAAQAGVNLVIVHASTEGDIDTAFSTSVSQGAGAMLVGSSPIFLSRRQQIVTLAAHHRMPTMYEQRAMAQAGGLMSYGTDLADAYRQAGVYIAKVLKGTKPADLPVMQATKFEFVINLVTAKALGLEISPTVLARADEVIE